jgi:hypothetical protein
LVSIPATILVVILRKRLARTVACGMNTLSGSIPANRRVPHISLAFREMWDTTGLPLKPLKVSQIRTGAPISRYAALPPTACAAFLSKKAA